MQVNIHRGADRIRITIFQGLKNLMVWRNSISGGVM
jgi:hypothetical protein